MIRPLVSILTTLLVLSSIFVSAVNTEDQRHGFVLAGILGLAILAAHRVRSHADRPVAPPPPSGVCQAAKNRTTDEATMNPFANA